MALPASRRSPLGAPRRLVWPQRPSGAVAAQAASPCLRWSGIICPGCNAVTVCANCGGLHATCSRCTDHTNREHWTCLRSWAPHVPMVVKRAIAPPATGGGSHVSATSALHPSDGSTIRCNAHANAKKTPHTGIAKTRQVARFGPWHVQHQKWRRPISPDTANQTCLCRPYVAARDVAASPGTTAPSQTKRAGSRRKRRREHTHT